MRRFMSSAASAASDTVIFEKLSARATRVLLNKPLALNALDLDMVRSMTRQLHHTVLAASSETKVLIFEGSGDKSFCAGGDVKSLYDSAAASATRPTDVQVAFFTEEYALDHSIFELRRNGIQQVCCSDTLLWLRSLDMRTSCRWLCMMALLWVVVSASPFTRRFESQLKLRCLLCQVCGLGSLSCQLVVLSFSLAETAIGLFPDVGGSYFLPRLPHNVGMYLALTGARLKGAETVVAGVATHYVPRSRLPALKDALAAVSTGSHEEVGTVVSSFAEDVTKGPSDLREKFPAIDR
jgi:enoyl-CoA hydratase/carnithine racemase